MYIWNSESDVIFPSIILLIWYLLIGLYIIGLFGDSLTIITYKSWSFESDI